jgi:hypothetical protein
MHPDIVDCAEGTWKSAYSEQEYEALHRPDNSSLHSETYFIPHGYRKKREITFVYTNKFAAAKQDAG